MKNKFINLFNQELFNVLIKENYQLADKLYFKTNKINNEDKNLIQSITNNDNYTKFISDVLLYYYEVNPFTKLTKDEYLKHYYDIITSYNNNVIPIKNFNLSNLNNINNFNELIHELELRNDILNLMKELPSIAIRNLKNDIRTERDWRELGVYKNSLEYVVSHLPYLNNRNDDVKNKIYNKIFKNNSTIESIFKFIDDKEMLIGGVDINKDEFINLIQNHSDMELIYDKNNIVIAKIESPQAIKDIGCNSLWCFTYGTGFDNAYKTWYNYSTNDIVYVITDFNLPQNDFEFMCVVIKPLTFNKKLINQNEEINDDKIYNMANEPHYYPLTYLDNIIGINTAKKLLTFDL